MPSCQNLLAIKNTQKSLIWQRDEVKNFLKMFFLFPKQKGKESPCLRSSRARPAGCGTWLRNAPATSQHSLRSEKCGHSSCPTVLGCLCKKTNTQRGGERTLPRWDARSRELGSIADFISVDVDQEIQAQIPVSIRKVFQQVQLSEKLTPD